MSIDPTKSTFRFFKLYFQQGVCGACREFDTKLFQQLINDDVIRNTVNIEKIEFGYNEKGQKLDLQVEYPDFNVTYGPYLYLSPPYDQSTKYHLNKETMNNINLNKRQDGMEFSFRGNTTYNELREWILQNAKKENSVLRNNSIYRKYK